MLTHSHLDYDSLPVIYISFLFGPVLLILGIRQFYLEIRPRWWKPVQGTIVESRIDTQNTGRSGQQYVPVIEFEHGDNGHTLHAKADLFTIGTLDSAMRAIEKYPIGSSVVVYVNPQSPNQSCLERKLTPLSFVLLFFGILLVGIDMAWFPF